MNGCKDCASRNKCFKNNWVVICDLGKTYKGELVCDNFNTNHYGIWNSMRKEFQFNVDEPTKARAMRKLHQLIGYDSYKWRFEAKQLPKEMWIRKIERIKNDKSK